MKAKTVIADYFSFNRAEQRGISILLALLLGLLLLNRLLPGSKPRPPVDSAGFEKEVLAFEQEIARAEEVERREKQPGRTRTYAFPAYTQDSSSRVKTPRAPSFTVDLNTADTLDLQRLRGIGPGFARRIVGYRNKLGGFVEKSQLLEVYGMDAERYAMIRDYVTVKRDSVKRIDLNTVAFKSLIGHPYFPYELTKEIILYRKKAKRFETAEELKNVSGVTDSVFRKVSPYIVVR
jgi:competence ComEA-like helix-hairpin-helix protein